jgi:hypothetical protein
MLLKQQLKNLKHPMWVKRMLPKAIRLLNENASARGGLPPCKLLARKAPKSSPHHTGNCLATDYNPELDSKALLLKTPHAVITGHQEIKLGPKRKLVLTG